MTWQKLFGRLFAAATAVIWGTFGFLAFEQSCQCFTMPLTLLSYGCGWLLGYTVLNKEELTPIRIGSLLATTSAVLQIMWLWPK